MDWEYCQRHTDVGEVGISRIGMIKRTHLIKVPFAAKKLNEKVAMEINRDVYLFANILQNRMEILEISTNRYYFINIT